MFERSSLLVRKVVSLSFSFAAVTLELLKEGALRILRGVGATRARCLIRPCSAGYT